MNKAEKELFALFVAELMNNKLLLNDLATDLIHPSQNEKVGEFSVNGEEGFAVGDIWYDPSKTDPSAIRENVLEKNERKREWK